MKKDWKSKLTSKTFWLSLAASVVIVLQLLGLKVDVPYVNEVISAIASVLIILGIIKNDTVEKVIEGEEESQKVDDEDEKNQEAGNEVVKSQDDDKTQESDNEVVKSQDENK